MQAKCGSGMIDEESRTLAASRLENRPAAASRRDRSCPRRSPAVILEPVLETAPFGGSRRVPWPPSPIVTPLDALHASGLNGSRRVELASILARCTVSSSKNLLLKSSWHRLIQRRLGNSAEIRESLQGSSLLGFLPCVGHRMQFLTKHTLASYKTSCRSYRPSRNPLLLLSCDRFFRIFEISQWHPYLAR